MADTKQTGEGIRRQVMGDAFVDRALGNATAFTQPLQDFVNEHAWGSVWARDGLPLKTRSLITLAALTALKCPQELKGHVRGALNNGCTVEEIREALRARKISSSLTCSMPPWMRQARRKGCSSWSKDRGFLGKVMTAR